jgi:YVTN family beta-propeller protein
MARRMRVLCWAAGLVALPLILSGRASEPVSEKHPDVRLRRPVALILTDDDRRLLVANRDSGTVSVVDTQRLQVVSETRVGGRLSDMAASRDREVLVASDEGGGAAVLLAYQKGALQELRRLKVGPTPVSVQVSDDGSVATVACLWPRRLVIVDLASAAKPKGEKETAPAVLDLPFAPRRQLLLPGGAKLVVADAFGDQLAVVDLRRRALESVRGLAEVHNIRGLALDRRGKDLLLTHQTLSSRGRPTPDDIRSGHLIDNRILRLPVAKVLEPSAGLRESGRQITLGDVERGAGDPAEAAENDGGQFLVTLAGTNELAVGWPEKATWTRLAVGQRPTSLAVDAARRRAFVANTFGDSVSVVDLEALKVVGEIRLGLPPGDLRPEERGEVLFHDARLSRDAWFSCHSCHTDGHTNGRLNDNLTDGSLGTPKRVLSLLGVKDTEPWAWNGKMADLPAQVRHSVTSTMQGRAPTDEQVRDLVAYLQTLSPPPSLTEARGTTDAEAVKRGRRVFEREKCAKCHTPPSYTSPGTYDVGLRDEAGETHFNPPSLRGVSQGGPYFHDGRAATLEEVFTRHRHRLADALSDDELRDLLHFLRSI